MNKLKQRLTGENIFIACVVIWATSIVWWPAVELVADRWVRDPAAVSERKVKEAAASRDCQVEYDKQGASCR